MIFCRRPTQQRQEATMTASTRETVPSRGDQAVSGRPPDIPLDIYPIVAVVADALAMTPHALLGGLDADAARGRRIAAALVARRTMKGAPTISLLFGMGIHLVGRAMDTLDAILAFSEASATHTPLVPLTAKVVAAWDGFETLSRDRVPIREIQSAVARVFQVSVSDIQSARREQRVSLARQAGLYLARRFTLESLARIADAFGCHHSSVTYAVARMTDPAMAAAACLTPDSSVEDWARALMVELVRSRRRRGSSLSRSSARAA
jgi:chromosomal replication initiation ATPase DnaA